MKIKKFDIKKEYQKSFEYLKNSKNYIYAVIGIFVFFTLFGFFVPASESVSNQIMKFLEELFAKTANMDQKELIEFILVNNIQSSFFGMILGFFFGIFSIITTIANGYLLGFVSALTVNSQGFGILWRLVPHGIFELPALFISLGLGLKLGTFFLEKEKSKAFRNYLWNSLRVFLYIIIPLLLAAALIEGSLIFLSS